MRSRDNSKTRELWLIVAAAIFLLGVAGWVASLIFNEPARAWRSMLINFIFFTPLAAGMCVWPAVVTAARGTQWLEQVKGAALSAVGFAPLSLIAFLLLWVGPEYWATWMHDESLHNRAYLNIPFMFARDIVALIIFWAMAAIYVNLRRRNHAKVLGVWLIVVYAVVFSLLGFDLVMALDPKWYSSLFGGYYFISGMYTAVAAWTLAVFFQRNPADVDHRHDLGRLIVAFSLLTTYMMYSQLLPIWYENLPHEARFFVPRLNVGQWQIAGAILLATIYLGPLVLLLTRWSKRSRPFLWGVASLVLAGMWLERWILVTPTLTGWPALGLPEISLTAAFAAAFAASAGLTYDRLDLSRGEGAGR